MFLSTTALAWAFAAAAQAAPLPAYPASVTGELLDPVPLEVLQEIMADAGEPEARVSSYQRTAEKQAALMYGICERDGVAKAKRLYSGKSHAILDAYARHQGEPEAEVVAVMAEAVRSVLAELGPGRRTMMHVESANYTFDIAPSSLASPARFKAALKRHPDLVRYFVPGGAERAFHLEVSREQHALGGTWTGTCDDSRALRLQLGFEAGSWIGTLAVGSKDSVEATVVVDRRARTMSFAAGADEYGGKLTEGYASLVVSRDGVTCTLALA